MIELEIIKIWGLNQDFLIEKPIIEKIPVERQRAYAKVALAHDSGKLFRKPCVVCGELKSHAHHEDYSKPLDVIYLCPKHHSAVHKGKIKLT